MEQGDTVLAQPLLVVLRLRAQIDDRADPMLARELLGSIDGKACTDRQRIVEPVKIRLPSFS